MSLERSAPATGKRRWHPSLSLASVLLLVSACGAPRMPTADLRHPPAQAEASGLAGRAAAHAALDRELTALQTDTLSRDDLDTKRGGFSVDGLQMSIGLQLSAEVAGVMQVVTNLTMNDAGQWTLVATSTQNFPTTGTQTAASPTNPQFVIAPQPQSGKPPTGGSPTPLSGGPITFTVAGDPATTPITPKTQNQFVITTSSGAPNNGSPTPPSTGPTSFTVVAGDPATTQVVQQLANNSLTTLVSNHVAGATVNLQSVLNISINNAAAIASTLGAITAANRIGTQVSLHR